ncbi:hypothetical protein V1514DRAFT_274964, partial [Lipomyces japonicus]|uniref:uncharacterized protein n=1 Tax=Lipomyces japonicus TaxID=56871 RepID=UPI0034CE91A9
KRRKRHGPAVSSAWVSQDSIGRGRPPISENSIASNNMTSSGRSSSSSSSSQQKDDTTEYQIRAIVEHKLADSANLRHASHASEIAFQIVHDMRLAIQSHTASNNTASFAWVFGGTADNPSDCENVEFEVQDVGLLTYVIEWEIEVAGATAKFKKSVTITNDDDELPTDEETISSISL